MDSLVAMSGRFIVLSSSAPLESENRGRYFIIAMSLFPSLCEQKKLLSSLTSRKRQENKKEELASSVWSSCTHTLSTGAKPAMSSPAQPAVPAPLANLKIQHTKVSHL